MSEDVLLIEDRGAVRWLTLNRPARLNALDDALIEAVQGALAAASKDEAVRVVVLSHTGPVFSAGADLTETATALASGDLPVARLGDAIIALAECPKPVVARIGGAVRGGGLGLVAAADIAVCATTAAGW